MFVVVRIRWLLEVVVEDIAKTSNVAKDHVPTYTDQVFDYCRHFWYMHSAAYGFFDCSPDTTETKRVVGSWTLA